MARRTTDYYILLDEYENELQQKITSNPLYKLLLEDVNWLRLELPAIEACELKTQGFPANLQRGVKETPTLHAARVKIARRFARFIEYFKLTREAYLSERWPEAQEQCEKALKQVQTAIGSADLAWCCMVTTKYPEAMQLSEESEALCVLYGLPVYFRIHNTRGAVYYSWGRYEMALEEYARAEKLRREQGLPELFYSSKNRGVVYDALGRHEEALGAYDKAEMLRRKQGLPEDWQLAVNRGVVYDALGWHEEALAAYDKAEQLRQEQDLPEDPGISFNRVLVYEQLGKRELSLLHASETIRRYSEQGQPVPRFIAELVQELTKEAFAPGKPVEIPEPPPSPKDKQATSKTEIEYDVFISHRRAPSADKALLLHSELESRGFKTYLDVDKQRKGNWRQRLLKAVRQSRNIVVILEKTSLDRCGEEKDMLRQELEVAQKYQRIVIPIQCENFFWHEAPKLPESIAWLPEQQSISFYRDYFQAFMDRLTDWLRAS